MKTENVITFPMGDGTQLAARCYSPETPRATALLIPGFALTSNDYATFSPALSRMTGAIVYSMDLRGQGQSGGTPGDIDHEDRLSSDISTMTAMLRQRHPKLPIWWIAHSSGASLALRTFHSSPDKTPDGLVLIAPVLCGHLEFDRHQTSIHRLRQRLRYGGTLPNAVKRQENHETFEFSLFRNLLARMFRLAGKLTVLTLHRPECPHPLTFSARFFQGYQCKDPAGVLEKIPCPLWMLIGDEDEYSCPAAVTGLVKWNTAPDRLCAAERIRGQGHFSILAVAAILLARWLC